MSGSDGEVIALPARGVPEVRAGDDLVALLAPAWSHADTAPSDGDVLVVTSKVVSKSEGRVLGPGHDRTAVVAAEADREVARRGDTRIVRTRHGFVMAAAGVDGSNVEPGSLVLLPLDPDASARRIRAGFARRGVHLGVVVSDTSGRAWRHGQTDLAVGAAGLLVLDDHQGREDAYGNQLAVTAPAVADEVAAVAELATGKVSGSPACLVRGLAHLLLPADDPGPGAAALVREEATDMFGLGAREAVACAVDAAADAPRARRGFGAPAPYDEVRAALQSLGVALGPDGPAGMSVALPADPFEAGRASARAEALIVAHGWRVVDSSDRAVRAAPRHQDGL